MSLSVHIEKQLGSFRLKSDLETDGGTTGLLGPSGCGKSFTLKCIAGIEKPDKGRIILNGVTLFDSERHINLPPQKRRVGYLFQNYALFPNMTVRQNILCGMKGEHDKMRQGTELERIVSLLQLEGLENHRPAQLSGGQAQRAALARILVGNPEILMLDEPFSALDSHLRGKLQIEMKELLSKFDKDVLLVTHSRDEAYHLCDKIAVMDSGRLNGSRPTKELFADPGSIQAALLTGCKNLARAEKAGEYEVKVPDWGITLKTDKPVKDGVVAVAVRAHYFQPNCPQNREEVLYFDEMEEPFEWIIQFRFTSQAADTEPIWWRIPKDRRPQTFPQYLGLAPANVLVLYS